MNLIFENDLTTISWLRFITCIICGLLFFYFEVTQKFQLSYSKFNANGTLDSKKGMFIIYFFPLLTYQYFYFISSFSASIYHQLIYLAVTLHFVKRCLEVLFLHKYSGKISKITTGLITWAYSSIAYSIHESVNEFTKLEMLEAGILPTLWIGFLIFILAQSLNLYHHIILSRLRSDSSQEYKIPNGGLFSLVNCPHYLFEIIAWIGIAMMSKYLYVYGLTFIMSAYLVGRSINTTKWYNEKISNFPKERKSIFPFIL